MGRVFYLLFVVGITLVRAAPKIEEATFSNLLEVKIFRFVILPHLKILIFVLDVYGRKSCQ